MEYFFVQTKFFWIKETFLVMENINYKERRIAMQRSRRIQMKILKYSFLCKLLGIIDEEDYNRIKENITSKVVMQRK